MIPWGQAWKIKTKGLAMMKSLWLLVSGIATTIAGVVGLSRALKGHSPTRKETKELLNSPTNEVNGEKS
jgi:hypothetical protein